MRKKLTYIILIFIAACFLLCNIGLLLLNQMNKIELHRVRHRLEHLEDVEFMYMASKEIRTVGFKYEQYSIANTFVFTGSDNSALIPVSDIAEQPKLVLGLNNNMCRPCVEGVFSDIKVFFSDFETNPNIICIADIEQRFKDNYFNKTVVSFHKKDDYPLYELQMPYFFILDKDLCVKLLFLTDKSNSELTQKYLKTIKERYPNI